MKQNDSEIYESLRFRLFSQGCEGQTFGMLRAIEPYLLSDFAYKHALLRVFFRPLFYMGYEDAAAPMAVIHTHRTKDPDCFADADALYRFMEQNTALIGKIIEELRLCNNYDDLRYDRERNAVVSRAHVFHDIEELWDVFLTDFRKLQIPDDEIRRIFEEESHAFFAHAFEQIRI